MTTTTTSVLRAAVLLSGVLFAAASGSKSAPPPQGPPPAQAPTLSTTGAGSALSRLTADPTLEVAPAISPDSTKLIYVVQTPLPQGGIGQSVIVGMDPRTSGGRTFYTASQSMASLPTWTPDGNALVFSSNALGSWNLVRTLSATPNAAVSLIVRGDLAPEPGRPSLSPDGKLVAFHTNMQGNWNVATATIEGGQLTILGEGVDPAWSPDGARIAFARRVNGIYQIFTLDARTGTGVAQITSLGGDSVRPCWSPDGQWLAFASTYGRVRGASNLFAIKADGTGLTQLTDGSSNVNSPAWSRDGWMYFTANQAGTYDIWRLKPSIGQ